MADQLKQTSSGEKRLLNAHTQRYAQNDTFVTSKEYSCSQNSSQPRVSTPAAWNSLSLFSRAAVFLLQHLLMTSLQPAAWHICAWTNMKNKLLVCILRDTGRSYLTQGLWLTHPKVQAHFSVLLSFPSQLKLITSLNKKQKRKKERKTKQNPTRHLHAHTFWRLSNARVSAYIRGSLPASQDCVCHSCHPASHTNSLLT